MNHYNPPSSAPSEKPPRLVIDHGITRRAISASEPLMLSGSRAELEEIARAILDHCEQAKTGEQGYIWIQFGPQDGLQPLINTVPTHWDLMGWQVINDGTKHHGAACVSRRLGTCLALRDGTKVVIKRGKGAENAHVWLEVEPLAIVQEAGSEPESKSQFDAPHRGTGPGYQ